MTAEDVDLAIIKPMCRLYKPTGHLQASEDAAEEALKEYRRALAPFDQAVLDQAHRELHPPGRIDELAELAEAMSCGATRSGS